MQVKKIACTIGLGVALLASGTVFAQNQQHTTSNFTKYLAPTPVRYIDFVTLQIKVAILEMHVRLGPEHILPIPTISYDPKNGRMEAFVSLSGEFAKIPVDEIQHRIHMERALINGVLDDWMPGLQQKDFTLIVNVAQKPFAECDRNDCSIH